MMLSVRIRLEKVMALVFTGQKIAGMSGSSLEAYDGNKRVFVAESRLPIYISSILALILLVDPAFATCKAPPVRQGMTYSRARAIVIKSGFFAPSLPGYGYSENDQKVISECNGNVNLCNKYPEIDSCSGDGYCRMNFTDAYGNTFSVVTYGEISDGSAGVTGVEITCKK